MKYGNQNVAKQVILDDLTSEDKGICYNAQARNEIFNRSKKVKYKMATSEVDKEAILVVRGLLH